MVWRRGRASRGDDPADRVPLPPFRTELPRPWDATPPAPEPDVLESGPARALRPGPERSGAEDPEVTPPVPTPPVPTPQGPTPQGPTPQRPLPQEPTPQGPTPRGTAPPGTALPGRGGRSGYGRFGGGQFGGGRFHGRSFGVRELLGALLVGLLLGGLLVHGYEDRLAEQARRDTIALSARVAPLDTSGGQGRDSWLLRIVVANRGETSLRLRSATLAETPLRSALRSVSTGVTLPAGKETWISMDVSGACAGGGLTRAPTALDVVVTAGDQPGKRIVVDLADDTSLLLSSARNTCVDSNFALWASAEQVGAAHIDKNGLFIPLRFRSSWSPTWEISGVRNEGIGLAATVAAALPIRFTDGVTPVTTVRWTITDCVQAKALGYTDLRLRTTLTLPDATRSIEVTTTLSGVLTEAVALFITRACQ